MQVIRDLAAVHLVGPSVLTIGTFDGLHLGHQALIKQLTNAAKQHQAQAVVLAFHPRPKTVLAPHLGNNDYLTTPEERATLLARLKIDVFVLVPFTLEFAQTTAYDFMKFLSERLNLVELWAGHDFALGKNREGNVEKLAELGREFNYQVHEVGALTMNGEIISSTQVRQLLLAGEVRQAAELLGRYPSLTSTIITGAKRGRTIGFPTANFAVPPERLLPANGVYATYVRYPEDGPRYASVSNIGVRPSFNEQQRAVEAYIFDFNETLYGQRLTVEFVERLRPELKFDSVEALVSQIRHDAEQARALLTQETPRYEL